MTRGAAEHPHERGNEHQVTPLELFFDLVFVFAITQVTSLLAKDPTWGGVLRGMLVLAAVWWAWTVYAWLTSTLAVDEGGVRLAMLAAMGAMLGVALAVPHAFGGDAVLFGAAYFLVRLLHVALSAAVDRDDPERRSALVRFAPTAMLGASLLLLAIRCPPSACAAAPPCTCSGTSPSSSGRPAESGGGGRWRRPSCLPSSLPRWRFRRSPRSGW